MFAAPCGGEAFAGFGMNAFMPVIANASPLHFQKTKMLRFSLFFREFHRNIFIYRPSWQIIPGIYRLIFDVNLKSNLL